MLSYPTIAVQEISPSKHQARKIFDEEAIKGLAESMKLEGLLQPVTVRKVGEGYELISGERRLRAAKLLGWPAIEAKVIETASEGEAAAKGLVENLQREDLNPIEEAEGFQELNQLDPQNWTQEKIAQVAGRDRTFVTRSLSLLRLPAVIQEDVRARTLSRSHGLELVRLPTPKQQLEVAKKIPGRLTWEETRKLVDSLLGQPKKAKQAPQIEPDPLASIWKQVQEDAGLPPGAWQVKYEGSFTWSFKASTRQVDLSTGVPGLRSALGQWFRAMADAMGETPKKEARTEPVKQVPVPTREVADIKRAKEELSHIRLPKTPEDWAEVEACATRGPAAVYAWVYGETSVMATQVAGLTWTDLGPSDPVKGCHQLIEALQKMREIS